MQRARTARVRTAALGTTVGLCLLIPLAAASADSAHQKSPSAYGASGPTATATAMPRPSGPHDFGNGVSPGSPEGIDVVKQLLADTIAPSGTPAAPATTAAPAAPASTPVSNSLCGKAVEAPGKIRAQTCVEREGSEVWGRVYYRNPAPEPLLVVLGLLKPDGDSVEIRCTVEAKSGEGQCETPRLRTEQPLSAWSAISEIATADGSRKVLRSGTASAAG